MSYRFDCRGEVPLLDPGPRHRIGRRKASQVTFRDHDQNAVTGPDAVFDRLQLWAQAAQMLPEVLTLKLGRSTDAPDPSSHKVARDEQHAKPHIRMGLKSGGKLVK